jgi:aminobenzoyl-glutamate utilization protein B
MKMEITAWIDKHQEMLISASDQIWEFAEFGYCENRSSELLSNLLEEAGFKVERGVADIPTAFVAGFGSGKPVIGILGEYDALPGISQEKVPYYQPRHPDANGHGCGHNLLGVGSLAACLAVKEAIQVGGLNGTIRYYGCPAEETGAGKGFMVRAGLFKDVDLALSWHPDSTNGVQAINTLALIMVSFRFHGKAAHAGFDPYNGRSALDAVELMNVGANYLREHIISEGRLHYVITNGGGIAPNVVPPLAESRYYVRAPRMGQADAIYKRLIDIGKGAALMTGTEMEILDKRGMSNLVLNRTINQVLYEKLQGVGAQPFTDQELEFAQTIATTFSSDEAQEVLVNAFGKEARKILLESPHPILPTSVFPNNDLDYVAPGSTDVGDVSWVVPTGQVNTTCMAFGTPGHSWQTVAQVGTGIGHKGMLYAGKVMALAALEFMSNPEKLEAATREFEQQMKDTPYVSPIAEDVIKPV